jgi:fumarate reductase subunit C
MTPLIHLIHLKRYHKMTPKALKVHLKPIKLLKSNPIICTLRATLVISRRATLLGNVTRVIITRHSLRIK